MELELITRNKLKEGDILLSRIPELSIKQYLQDILKVIINFASTRKFDMDAASSLIHWIIGFFDQYHYFHASFWNGEMVVESRMKGGLRANDISTYKNNTVDVFRYIKDGEQLGPPALPVDPLLSRAQALVDEHLPYGYDSASLLAILCVERWHRSQWVDSIRKILVHHVHSRAVRESIESLFDLLKPHMDHMIEELIVRALDVVRKYRDRKGYVCSQTVAIVYNEAADKGHPAGTYAIDKPSYVHMDEPLLLAVPLEEAGEDEKECLEVLESIGAELAKLPAEPAVRAASGQPDYDMLQKYIKGDSFYTPRDLAESDNTMIAGRLKL